MCTTFTEPIFLQSLRGKRQIKLNGYKYSEQKLTTLSSRWYCSSHHSKGCKAVLKTIDDVIVYGDVKHIHDISMRNSSATLLGQALL